MLKLFAMIFSIGGLCFLCVSGIIGAFLWPYVINTWLAFFGKPESVLWWQGFLLGMFPGIGQMHILLAIVTWIAMKFLM